MQRTLFLVCAILLFFDAKGQIQEESNFSFDIGINVTSIISTFVGNDNNLNASDFPLQFTIGRESIKFRFGIGAESSNKSIFDQITLVNRRSQFIEVATRLGVVKNVSLTKRFSYYWGADLIFLNSSNKVETSFTTLPSIEENTIGLGGGPIFGLRLNLSKRIYLSTEATLYGLYKEENRTSSLEEPMQDSSFELMINPPLFLYLNVSLGK